MALPLSGQISLGDVRTELDMSVSDFSLFNACTSTEGYPSKNVYSYFQPDSSSLDLRLGSWLGYDHNIGYVEITLITSQFQCSPTDVVTYGYQYIEYFNKSGISVSSPYNISINGALALPINSLPGIFTWNQYEYNDCNPSLSYGAYIDPTSVTVTETTKKVYVLGIGFL